MDTITPLEIAGLIVGSLLTLSRFVQAAKAAWSRLPRWAAVLAPAVVAVIPAIVELVQQVRTWADLVTQVIASTALVIVNLFPKHEPAVPAERRWQ